MSNNHRVLNNKLFKNIMFKNKKYMIKSIIYAKQIAFYRKNNKSYYKNHYIKYAIIYTFKID